MLDHKMHDATCMLLRATVNLQIQNLVNPTQSNKQIKQSSK
jgi:hypothetical protein